MGLLEDLGAVSALGEGIFKGATAVADIEDKKKQRELLAKKMKQQEGADAQEAAFRNKQLQIAAAKEGLEETPDGGYARVKGWKSPEEKIYARMNYADSIREKREQAKLDAKEREMADPAKRLAKQPGEVRQKLGFVTSGLENLSNYEDTFRKGGRQSRINSQTPLLGSFVSSTPIDDARINMEESIGRLASGGAINTDEEKRFRQMIPRAGDNDQDAARKLIQLRSEMENKLTGYGFSKDDLPGMGFDSKKLGYGTEYASMPQRGLLTKQEQSDQSGGLLKNLVQSTAAPKEAFANQSQSKPDVVQNGQVYKWNPKTQRYE